MSADVEFPPGMSVIVGDNGAGKTSLLEAARLVVCGRSFRTSSEAEMIREGESFLRLEAEIESQGAGVKRSVVLEAGAPARVESGGGPRWMPPGAITCFTPDYLQLVKGPPAPRRRFVDEAIARRQPQHHRLALDYQKVLSQRNRFLQRARAGTVRLGDIAPWDRQLASLALQIHRRRRRYLRSLLPFFSEAYRDITGGTHAAGISYHTQLQAAGDAPNGEEELIRRLEDGWTTDLERLSTGLGTHRDDVGFIIGGRSARQYGSQGEQRAAVLALLLADRALACEGGGPVPLVLLDDVMSELDAGRRQNLVGALRAAGGQVIVTAAEKSLFPGGELMDASMFEVYSGAVNEAGAGLYA